MITVDLRIRPFAIYEKVEVRLRKGRNLVRWNEQPNCLGEAKFTIV